MPTCRFSRCAGLAPADGSVLDGTMRIHFPACGWSPDASEHSAHPQRRTAPDRPREICVKSHGHIAHRPDNSDVSPI
jgi:hypothetical protein